MNLELKFKTDSRVVRSLKNKKIIGLDSWIESKARLCEVRGDYPSALRFWNLLLKRMLNRRERERADVTKLAAIHYRLGIAHRALKDIRKSFHHLKYCVRLNSNEARYFDAFGQAYLSGGHWVVASEQFQRALKLEPSNPAILRRQAWVYLMLEKKELALRTVERALFLRPKSRESLILLARVHSELGNYLKAIEILTPLRVDSKVQKILRLCRDRFLVSFAGATLSIAKRGMICEPAPFKLSDLRKAHQIWKAFCEFTPEQVLSVHLPNAWAAALAWYILCLRGADSDYLVENIAQRFGATGNDLWPCLLRMQRMLNG